MAKVVKVDKVLVVQAWWSEFRPSEPTERLGGHGVALWSAVNPASSRDPASVSEVERNPGSTLV